MLDMQCVHCKSRVALKPRGLCKPCWRDRTIRQLYAPVKHVKHVKAAQCEPTQEEVDAMVAQQYKKLPPWWNKEKP